MKKEKELIVLTVIAVVCMSILEPKHIFAWILIAVIVWIYRIFGGLLDGEIEVREEKEIIPEPVEAETTAPVIKPVVIPPAPEKNYVSQYVIDTKKRIARELRNYYKTNSVRVVWKDADEMNMARRSTVRTKVFINQIYKDVVIEYNPNSREVSRIIVDSKDYIKFGRNKSKKPDNSSVQPKKPDVQTKKPEVSSGGNTFINEDGKEEVKPNFTMIAKDWVNENLAYLNQVCNNALNPETQTVKAVLEASHLPNDKESWVAIGKSLVEQEEIDAFEVQEDGILIIIE